MSNTTTAAALSPSSTFTYPIHYSFPPFFSLQPVASTRSAQLASWSSFIQSYCRHAHTFSLSLIDALDTPLFHNAALGRRLALRDARTVVAWMSTSEGGNRAEFVNGAAGKKSSKSAQMAAAGVGDDSDAGGKVWIFWRRPEEWAAVLEEWVDRTGQRGTVLTLYEIVEGDASRREEFWGMEIELLRRCLGVCVKRGKAQIFGGEGSEGVKFF